MNWGRAVEMLDPSDESWDWAVSILVWFALDDLDDCLDWA